MPLNRPALSLGPGPRGVQDARRWVVDTCHDIGRDDLVECAELGVSELVTNALLHGAPPLTVRVRGTREHPRVEVRDGSTEVPVTARAPRPTEDDDLLLTFGRGLSIVARCSTPGASRSRTTARSSGSPRRRRAGEEMVRGRDHRRAGHARAAARPPDEMRIDIRRRTAAVVHRLPAALPRAAPRGPAAGAGARGGVPARQGPLRPVRRARPRPARGHRRRADRRRAAVRGGDHRPARGDAARDRGDDRPVHRAARPRRRVLPRGAAALAGPDAGAAAVPALVPQRVRATGRRASRRWRGRMRPCPGGRAASRDERRPRRGWSPRSRSAARSGRSPAGGSPRRSRRRRRLPVDDLRDQRGRVVRCSRCCPRSRSYAAAGPRGRARSRACSAASPRCRRTPSRPGRCWTPAGPASRSTYLLGTLAACLVAVAVASHWSTGAGSSGSSPPRAGTSDRAAGRPGRGGRCAAAVRARHPPRRAAPVGHVRGQRRRLVPARRALRARAVVGRGRPARRRLLRRLHDLLRVRRADPRPRRQPGCGVRRRHGRASRWLRVRWDSRSLREVPAAPRLRRSRGRAAGRRRCRSGGRSRGRR